MIREVFVIAFLGLLSFPSWGAPCCGSMANNPSLITGDDRFQFTSTFSSAQVIAEAPVSGGIKYRPVSDSEQRQSLRIDSATLLSDRTQLGVTVPLVRRARTRGTGSAEAMGLGDISASLAYEFIPEWNFSWWRPKVFLFFGGVFPTGGSIYDSEKLYAIDSRGRGFWGASLGTLILKSWGNFDVSVLLEGHRFLAKEKSTDLGTLRFSPGMGDGQSLGVGWSPNGAAVRLGMALNRTHEGAIDSSGVFEGRGEPSEVWTGSVQLGYLISSETSLNLNFSDQTIINRSANSALNRSLALVFQQRWER